MLTLPDLDQLRHQLAIPSINTGRKIHLFEHRAGPVIDDIEGLHAIRDEQGAHPASVQLKWVSFLFALMPLLTWPPNVGVLYMLWAGV